MTSRPRFGLLIVLVFTVEILHVLFLLYIERRRAIPAEHAFLTRLWSCLYGKFVVDGDGPNSKWCSFIVSDGGKRVLGVVGT